MPRPKPKFVQPVAPSRVKYRCAFDCIPDYTGPDMIGEQLTLVPLPIGPDWIGKAAAGYSPANVRWLVNETHARLSA